MRGNCFFSAVGVDLCPSLLALRIFRFKTRAPDVSPQPEGSCETLFPSNCRNLGVPLWEAAEQSAPVAADVMSV